MSLETIAPPPCSSRPAGANVAPTQLPVLPLVPLALPPLPASRGDGSARLGRGRRRLRHGRCLRRPPGFAMAILGRVLEAAGFRVAILSQPDWRSAEPWRQFGRPRLFFGISAGNMDSMINHYTANKKVRNDDAYSPGGRIGLRPDRATLPYCQRAREAFPGVPVIAGGVEASRCGGWPITTTGATRSSGRSCSTARPTWSSSAWASSRSSRSPSAWPTGESVRDLRDMRGVAYALGAKEEPPAGRDRPALVRGGQGGQAPVRRGDADHPPGDQPAQRQGGWSSITTARRWSPTRRRCRSARRTWTRSTACPTRGGRTRCTGRRSPPSRWSRTRSRSCAAASAAARSARSRRTRAGSSSRGRKESVLAELRADGGQTRSSRGRLSDIGGPTANMYQMRCTRPEVEAKCQRLSCVHPTICKLLGTDHGPLVQLMRESREVAGHRQGAGRLRHPHGPGPQSPEYMRRARRRTTSAATSRSPPSTPTPTCSSG